MASNILEGFTKKADFAREHDITERSVDRYRELGLPWMKWGREVWIGPDEEARAWLLARVHRANPKFHPHMLTPVAMRRLERAKRGETPDGPTK